MMLTTRTCRRYAPLAALVLCASCGEPPSGPGDGPPAALDALPRSLTTGEQKVITAANDFSFSLFRQLTAAQKDTNVFVSPFSASMALGMTMNGAAGATYDQMRGALAFGSASEPEINEGYKSLIALLTSLDPTVDVRVANSIWYRNTFPFNQSFLDAGRTWFGAEVGALDFASPSAPDMINNWVSSATAGKIPSIIDQIDPFQVMFLINAIYFKGSWRDRFDPAETRDAPFHSVGGDQPARLMHRHGSIGYLATTDFEAADLPYGNTAFTMTVVLPREGKSTETIASSLRTGTWSTWMGQFHDASVDIYLPRFRLTWERKLNDDLIALGMRDAFVKNGGDFTRMSPRGRELFISVVKQKTYVDVNEEGTEAAAATSVGIGVTSAPLSIMMRVDRPFLFVIRERLSGTVVFMGRIVTVPA
jgi:serine protease inhibitor